ncbi:TRAP transporter substrate-binding protein [Rubrimonas sp.]|uniref:TRAP transporter substrate-binding protein n=1 Tax=Rubrimonas sp. TaxID=2036015 RepID=UPI002FDC8853
MPALFRTALALTLAAGAVQAQTPVRWLSQSQAASSQYPVEAASIEALGAAGFRVDRSEFQALGINMADGLRLIRSGAFDVASIQVGLVASDDPFLEGIDLIGVSTDVDALRESVDAYRAVFAARLEERFDVIPVALWPFGGQIFFCAEPIATLADMQGKKVRSFTASMSAMLERLGASPVTLAFPEVYPALQRGVASCGITSATSANTGKWPEVTTHVLPLSVSGSVQAHVVNASWWRGLTDEQRTDLSAEFAALEDALWALAATTNDMALSCTTGGACDSPIYGAYGLTLVELADSDFDTLRAIAEEVVLTDWATRCERVYAGCAGVWNDTVGAVRGMSAPTN